MIYKFHRLSFKYEFFSAYLETVHLFIVNKNIVIIDKF